MFFCGEAQKDTNAKKGMGINMNLEDFFCTDDTELPLDRPVADGGFSGILRQVACIGDSLSSGTFEPIDAEGIHHYMDQFDYSWGQFFARMSGNEVLNFSRGGMSAKYYESFAEEMGYFDPDKAAPAYIVALGVNDHDQIQRGEVEFGSMDDIDWNDLRNNRPTFVGYYGKILQRYREISPKSRIFLVTLPKETRYIDEKRIAFTEKHRELLYSLADKLDFCYVIDLYKYAVEYDKDFEKKFYFNNHLSAAGYMLTAKMMASYIDYIIRHNMDDFVQLALINAPFHDEKYKW